MNPSLIVEVSSTDWQACNLTVSRELLREAVEVTRFQTQACGFVERCFPEYQSKLRIASTMLESASNRGAPNFLA
jgi:hypothetical protein